MHLSNNETDEMPPFMGLFDFSSQVNFEMPGREPPPDRMPVRKEK